MGALERDREGKRGKEQEHRPEQQVSEDRWETENGAPTQGSLEREREREERSNLADAGWILPEGSVHKM